MKKEYVEAIKKLPLIKSSIDLLSGAEQKHVEILVDDMADKISSSFSPVIEKLQTDKDFAREVRAELMKLVRSGKL
jgi:hypothetical protein